MRGKAVVFPDKGQVVFNEVDIPEPGSEDVVIDVEYSWISTGTESSFFRGERLTGERLYRRGDPWPFPIVAGYQKVGTVRSVGAAVIGLKPGDRVFATVSHIKEMHFPFGGHITPAVTPMQEVWKLPEDANLLDYTSAVLTQVGYNCGTRPVIREGDWAVIIGDGLVGQWAAQTLLHRGARVAVIGRHEERLRLLPTEVRGIKVNVLRQGDGEADSYQSALAFCAGEVAALVDTVGDMQACRAIQPLLGRGSHWVSAGFLGETGAVDIQSLRDQEITLHSPSGWTRERMDRTMEGIAAGWLRTAPLLTHRFPVERVQEAWQLIVEKNEPFLGILLDWTKED
ncbi:putative zinc-type alcohol dehydrogenase-like protein YjmD [compost metagenome]